MLKTIYSKTRNIRFQFLVIALSLFVVTTILGLSAYLSDKASEGFTFKTIVGEGVDIALTPEGYTSTNNIYPGESIPMAPVVTNTGEAPAYVFITFDTSSDKLTIPEEAVNDDNWKSFSVDGQTVYAYVDDDGGLKTISEGNDTSAPFDSIQLDPSLTSLPGEYDATVTAYAIQSAGMEGSDSDIFKLAAASANAKESGND